MFNKILIANRGEIAVRVIRTCRELGIKTVAVYSELDRNALHVRLADEAYALEGKTSRESYLNTEKILEVLINSKAEAVHPGYGFFSENADFARAISKAGAVFIGPPPDAIEIMGDKISARKAAEAAGVSGVPGITHQINDPKEILSFGEKYGWPVAIKAAFGGGGKGMKVVESPQYAQEAMESAMREALAAFGRSEVYLEKYLDHPKHIEMQVFGDHHGNVIWLGERDCSIQRRHQKIVEETPSPGFPDEIRRKMGEAAVAICKSCNYTNAGTIEFLYQDGEFYFLEMNTRLQVEHPITEATTGLDLVALQIKVASGEPLGIQQDQIKRIGHAIELRLNAEDPSGGKFLPTPGKITELRWPDGIGVRVDTGYEAGDSISQFYDNLIAKLIAWAPDRETARKRALRMLQELEVQGIATTKEAHQIILSHPTFIEGNYSTKWLEDKVDLSQITPFKHQPSDQEDQLQPQSVTAEINGKRYEVKLFIDGSFVPAARKIPQKTTQKPKTSQHLSSTAASGTITVPMQGTVVRVMVNPGDRVEAGQTVCILEAMKMENLISSEKDGVVKEIKVSPGDTVSPGEVLMVIE